MEVYFGTTTAPLSQQEALKNNHNPVKTQAKLPARKLTRS